MKYYRLLDSCIDGFKSTEKATAIITGDNGCVTKQHKYFYEFIANSQIKNERYVPHWIAKNINNAIDWNDSIEIGEDKKQSKPHKTKEQKEIEHYNLLLKSNFNNGIPAEYIEYWFEDDTSVYGTRFTTIDKLENRLAKDNIIKINIIRNGQKETIRG
jgi:hypothetical protein